MKKILTTTLLITAALLACYGAPKKSAKKTGLVSRPDSRKYTIPKDKKYSYVEYSDSLLTAKFEGKEYELRFDDEFDGKKINRDKWDLSHALNVGPVEAKDHDGSWLGSKIVGVKSFDKIVVENPYCFENEVFGEKTFYTEDGVLHMNQIRKKIGNDWHVFAPGIISKDVIERGTIVEIRYKYPVRGRCTVFHACLNMDKNCLGTDWEINDKNWTFQQLFLGEYLTGVPNQIRYGASMWFAPRGEATNHDIDYAIPDHKRNDAITFDYGNNLNAWDDNSDPYWCYDDDFYEWHTTTIIYDDERFANYQDGLKIYEWKWADHPECGMPQDAVFKNGIAVTGGGKLGFSYSLSGDWAETNDPAMKALEKKWVGEFEDKDDVFDFQMDYVRVYKIIENGTAEDIEKRSNWFEGGKETGCYDLYSGNCSKGITPVKLYGFNYSKSAASSAPISFANLHEYQDFGLAFDEIKDLSDLRKQNLYVEMDIKTLENKLNLTAAFVNSKEKSEFAWKYEYIITNSKVPADGKWHKVRIPLSSFKAGGIWDSETSTYHGPEDSKFTWKNVYEFTLNNGPDPLTHLTEVNNIRIVK